MGLLLSPPDLVGRDGTVVGLEGSLFAAVRGYVFAPLRSVAVVVFGPCSFSSHMEGQHQNKLGPMSEVVAAFARLPEHCGYVCHSQPLLFRSLELGWDALDKHKILRMQTDEESILPQKSLPTTLQFKRGWIPFVGRTLDC